MTASAAAWTKFTAKWLPALRKAHTWPKISWTTVFASLQMPLTRAPSSNGDPIRAACCIQYDGLEPRGTVSIELDAKRLYFREGYSLEETSRRMKEIDLSGRVLVNAQGQAVPCTVEDLGLQFGYDLPDDRFRQPYMCRRVRLTFEASAIPAMGLTAYAWVKSEVKPAEVESLISNANVMENELIKVEIQGTVPSA